MTELEAAQIEKWTPGNLQGTVVAGTGVAGSGLDQLNSPTGIYVNSTGDIYASDLINNRIVKWTHGASQGVIIAGTGTQEEDLTGMHNLMELLLISMEICM